MKFRKARIALR